MNTHDDILERMSSANPLADPEMITDGQLAELTLQIEEQRRTSSELHDGRSSAQPGPGAGVSLPRWLRPALAFTAACLLVLGTIGAVTLFQGDEPLVIDETPATTAPSTTTPTPSRTRPPVDAIPISNPLNQVFDIAVAPDGTLWTATSGGIVHWDVATQTPTVYTAELGLPIGNVLRLVVDAAGTVWTGADGWIASYDGSWTIFSAPRDSGGPLAIGPDGSVWVAFGECQLGRFDGAEWEYYQAPLSWTDSVGGPWTSSLAIDPNGTVWVGNNFPDSNASVATVYAFDGASWTPYSAGDGIPDRVGSSVAVAPDGTVWVGSFSFADGPGGGVARFDGTTWTTYTTADGLASDNVEVVTGPDGSVWSVGIVGVSRFDGTSWIPYPTVSGDRPGPAVDAAGTLWMAARGPEGGIIGFDGTTTTRLVAPTRDPISITTTPPVPADGWSPILAETRAGPAPPAATCPSGTDPSTPGPASQSRPEAEWAGVQAGAFNTHTGRILYVDTLGKTWTFDVCTNTWEQVRPDGAMLGSLSGGMVYDIDSDVTVAFAWGAVSAYDATTNTWVSRRAFPGTSPFGAVYDPLSGLIVTTSFEGEEGSTTNPTRLEAWAFDVDADTWTYLGRLRVEGDEPVWEDLLGYSPELDRLIFGSLGDVTALVDPRSGERTELATPTPGVGFGWPMAQFGPAGNTVFVARGVTRTDMIVDQFEDQICGFDPETSAWSRCFGMPGGPKYAAYGAMVGDPINNRLVLIHGIYGNFWVDSDDAVWTIDLDTGKTTELLGQSG